MKAGGGNKEESPGSGASLAGAWSGRTQGGRVPGAVTWSGRGCRSEQVEGGKDIPTLSWSAVGRSPHSCVAGLGIGWRDSGGGHRLRVEGNRELLLQGASSLSGDRFPLSCGRPKLYAKPQGRRQRAVARKSLKLQEETRDETDRWSGAPRGRGGVGGGL